MADMSSPLAPGDNFPERVTNVFEAKMAPNAPGGRGPMHFEEGIATDTDVPNDFILGIRQGYETGPRPNMNMNVFEKPAADTTRERAHVGSASWVEAPEYLGAFSGGASNEAERAFIQVSRGAGLGQKYHRQDAAVVRD
jgi:hypothetical protein